MSRVLIADDQVPKGDLRTEEEIRRYYRDKYNDPGFAEGFVFLYKLIRTLKSLGYKVDAVDAPGEVVKVVAGGRYDVIVLDLGWWTEHDLPEDDRMVLGWSISDKIKEHTSAPIIMFSSRFFEDHDLARTAVEKGLLPVYKSYDEVSIKQVIVAMRYALMTRPAVKELVLDEHKVYAFKMYRRLSAVLLGAIIASVTLLLVSVTLAVLRSTTESIVSSAFGFVLTFINGAVFRYIEHYKKDFT